MFKVWVVRWSWDSDLGRAQESLRITDIDNWTTTFSSAIQQVIQMIQRLQNTKLSKWSNAWQLCMHSHKNKLSHIANNTIWHIPASHFPTIGWSALRYTFCENTEDFGPKQFVNIHSTAHVFVHLLICLQTSFIYMWAYIDIFLLHPYLFAHVWYLFFACCIKPCFDKIHFLQLQVHFFYMLILHRNHYAWCYDFQNLRNPNWSKWSKSIKDEP